MVQFQFRDLLIFKLKGEPERNQKYRPQSSRYSANSRCRRCLEYFLFCGFSERDHLPFFNNRLRLAGRRTRRSNDLTYEMRIVSVESDEEAEQVTERHDKFQELIESKNLQKVEKDLYHQFSIIEMGSSLELPGDKNC